MRLDAYLKKSMLIKRREVASGLCDEGLVRVNGLPRKASYEVKAGDELGFPLANRIVRVRVLALPEGNVRKSDQWSLFEVLEDRRLPEEVDSGDDFFWAKSRSPQEH